MTPDWIDVALIAIASAAFGVCVTLALVGPKRDARGRFTK